MYSELRLGETSVRSGRSSSLVQISVPPKNPATDAVPTSAPITVRVTRLRRTWSARHDRTFAAALREVVAVQAAVCLPDLAAHAEAAAEAAFNFSARAALSSAARAFSRACAWSSCVWFGVRVGLGAAPAGAAVAAGPAVGGAAVVVLGFSSPAETGAFGCAAFSRSRTLLVSVRGGDASVFSPGGTGGTWGSR